MARTGGVQVWRRPFEGAGPGSVAGRARPPGLRWEAGARTFEGAEGVR